MEPLVRDLNPLLKTGRTTYSKIGTNTRLPNLHGNTGFGRNMDDASVVPYTFSNLRRASARSHGPTTHHLSGKTFSHDGKAWMQSYH
jgi:hypothetical protein